MLVGGKNMSDVDVKKELLDSFKNNVNVPGLVSDLVTKIADPALRAAVAKTDTKIDDLVVATIAPELERQLISLITEKWKSLFP